MLRALSGAEICKAKASVKTIDDAQGNEADFVITVYTPSGTQAGSSGKGHVSLSP